MTTAPFPQEVRIENTNMCNARCVMCPREKLTRLKGIMPLEFFKKLIDQCVELNVKMVHVHGFGEPLLDKNIFEKIKYAKEKGLTTYMVTNASLLNEKNSIKLIESGLDAMNITFSGITKEIYESVHVNLSFETTFNNVNRFFKIKREMGAKFPRAGVKFMEMKETTHEKEKFIEYWNPIANDLIISPCHNYGSGREYVNVGKNLKRESCGRIFFLHAFQILWDGRIVPCCFDFNGEIILGDTNVDSLIDIWNGEDFVKFRDAHEKGEFYKYPYCDKCEQLIPQYRIVRNHDEFLRRIKMTGFVE
jgi:radical SAM protein with 4Fe4S-binding SPASM domain